jgi:predicted dehydrogenase
MIRIGVLGTSAKGKSYLHLLKDLREFSVTGIYDPDPAVASALAQEFQMDSFGSPEALLEGCDAAVITCSSSQQHELARAALRSSRHILLGGPVALRNQEAKSIISLMKEARVQAQAVQSDRFNPALRMLKRRIQQPRLIESRRLLTWDMAQGYGNLVLDVMLQDIDVIMSLVQSTVRKVSATGAHVVGSQHDVVNARIEFHNGCVAQLTVSRIAPEPQNLLRIFQKNCFMELDYLREQAQFVSYTDSPSDPRHTTGIIETDGRQRFVSTEVLTTSGSDPIRLHLEDFARSVAEDRPTSVTLEDAIASLEVAYQVLDRILGQ